MLAIKGLILSILLFGGIVAPVQDIHFGQRTVLVADPNHHTLTIIGGVGELWVCSQLASGKTCKSGEEILNYITRNGDTQP